MAKMRVADYITEYLYTNYDVKHIFMLSGGGSIYLDDSVALHPQVKDICIRNEATAPMMANGYVKSGAKLGVAYVTTGPGSANSVSGLVESWVDSCPVLIVSGQVSSDQTIQSKQQKNIPPLRSYGTQELDILNVVAPITKKCLRLENPSDVKKYLDELCEIALTDRKGPVWLEVPLDIQSAYIDDKELSYSRYVDYNLKIDAIKDVIEKIKKSDRPLILAGQGVRHWQTLERFIPFLESTGIPVILSRMAIDSIPYNMKYNLGIGGIKGKLYNKTIMKDADLIIALGTTLSPAFVGKDLEFLGDKIVIVDVDKAELNKFNDVKKEITKINMNTFDFCEMASSYLFGLANYEFHIEKWQKHVLDVKIKNSIEVKGTTPIDIYDLVKAIDMVSKEGDIFVSDAGSSYYVTQQVLQFNKKGQQDLTSGAYASMGVAIPLAIGAALNHPNNRIIVITGDGSIETNIQELKTLSYYGLHVAIFIINNGGYISMRDHQDTLFDGRYINATAETGNPVLNFKDIAKAFGLNYENISDGDELALLLKVKDVLNAMRGPTLIEVICDPNQKLINPISVGEQHGWMA